MGHLVTIDVNDPDHKKREKKVLMGFSVRKEKSGYTVTHDMEVAGGDASCGPWAPSERHAFDDYDAMKAHITKVCKQLGESAK